jgi:hypothetical protein
MPHALSGLFAASLIMLIVAVVRLHYLRAKIASEVFDDRQFEQFQRDGMPGSGLNDPTRLIWEYRFVRKVLSSSHSRVAAGLLKHWNWCFRALLGAAISFASCSIISILFGW